MTPVSLNPPGPSIGQNQLFISPNNQDCRFLFNTLDQSQSIEIGRLRENYHQDIDKLVLHDDGSSSSNHQLCNSISCDRNLSSHKMEEEDSKNGHGCAKWMSSKMRLMKKMMRPSSSAATDKAINTTTTSTTTTITTTSPRFQNEGHQNRYSQRSPRNNSTTTTRVCSDCNTSSTPLWRSGPKGPKSLCNACGIRQRKLRRAMAEAANGLAKPVNAPSTKTRVHNKEKKYRKNHFAQLKNKYKTTRTSAAGSSQGVRKLECFKDLAISLSNNLAFHEQVFPRDEVAEAALLLMDLSCGFHF
ncbi:putative GATA transcription factor 22 [Gastrolobium bilobum]|uniref:putative GATA transcription factor 22 n=1 Tax=Gastrolobium bilobum TaxID=150636 RepID=UPI002AB118EF|nr:putative GATA transcription factor 22 [Gastrolobium bilobum]